MVHGQGHGPLLHNRSEWWRRFTWAVENASDDTTTDEVRRAARIELDELDHNSLARNTERELITRFYRQRTNGTDTMKEKDGGNNE